MQLTAFPCAQRFLTLACQLHQMQSPWEKLLDLLIGPSTPGATRLYLEQKTLIRGWNSSTARYVQYRRRLEAMFRCRTYSR